MRGALKSLMPSIAFSALVSFASVSAAAGNPAKESEDNDSATALMAAPWLVCDFGPRATSGTPEAMGWSWDRESHTFSPLRAEELFGKSRVIVVFDEDKHRAATVIDGQVHPNKDPLEVLYPERLHGPPLFPIVIARHFREAPASEGIVILTLSYLRSPDGRFAAVSQMVRLPGGIFFFDPINWDFSIAQVFGSCAATADDALRPQIEQARAEWLALPATEPAGSSEQ
jgi:hypothetical protein